HDLQLNILMQLFWEDNQEMIQATDKHPTRFPPELIILYELLSIYSLVLRFYREAEKNQRSEEHTSELKSRFDLVCRLLLDYQVLYSHMYRDDSTTTVRRSEDYTPSLHDALPISEHSHAVILGR